MPRHLLVLTVPLTLQLALLDTLLLTLFAKNALTTVRPVEAQELASATSATLATSYSMVKLIALSASMGVAAALPPIPEPVSHAQPATTSMPPLKSASAALLHVLAAHLPLPACPAKMALLSPVTSATRPLPSPVPLRQEVPAQPAMLASLFQAQLASQT